jgi:hypothetical protein
MKNEFIRFKLEKIALIIILLELAGAIGLLIGLLYRPLLLISSLGIALLMFSGLIVRIRLKDSLLDLLPALFFLLLNAFIFFTSIGVKIY